MLKYFSLFIFYLIFISASAQLNKNYFPMQSSGKIQAAVTSEINKIVEDDNLFLQKCKTEEKGNASIQLSTDYFLKEILLSGSVVYNDSIGNYYNSIADELLKNKPEIRNKIHIYCTRFSVANTYAFNKGYILINVGLLAQCDNEAQVAAFIAHSIGHIILNHTNERLMNSFTYENVKYGNTYLEVLERDLKFSDTKEIAADSVMIELLKTSVYSTNAAEEMLNVIKFSYLPFNDVAFKKSFFENKNLIFPDTLFLKKITDINTDENNKISRSFRPDLQKRLMAMGPELTSANNSNKKQFVVSKIMFQHLRDNARFELVRIYSMGDYMNAIYGSYLLSSKYPDNLFLKETIAKALYYIAIGAANKSRNKDFEYKNVSEEYQLTYFSFKPVSFNLIEGNSQQLYYLFSNLNSNESNVVALSYTWNVHKQYPSNKIIKTLCDSLMFELVIANGMRQSDFSEFTREEIKRNDSIEKYKIAHNLVDTTETLSKYDKIKRQVIASEIQTNENFVRYAFVDLFKDEEFMKLFNLALTNKNRNLKSTTAKEEKALEDLPMAELSNKKIVFVNPVCRNYSKIKDDFFISTDDQNLLNDEFVSALKKKSEINNFTSEFISTNSQLAVDAELINAMGWSHDWFYEKISNGTNADLLVLNTTIADKLIAKYGTPYFVLTNVSAVKSDPSFTYFFFTLCNVATGEMIFYHAKTDKYFTKPSSYSMDISNYLSRVATKKK